MQSLLQAAIAFTKAAANQLPDAQLSTLITEVTSDCKDLLNFALQTAAATAECTAAAAAAAAAASATQAAPTPVSATATAASTATVAAVSGNPSEAMFSDVAEQPASAVDDSAKRLSDKMAAAARLSEARDAALSAFADAMSELKLWQQPADVAAKGCKVSHA